MNLINKLNTEKNVFSINLNWAMVLAFISFWSYGFFGVLTAKSFGLAANIIISLVLCGIFILFLWLWKNDDSYEDKIIIKNKDIFAFASFFLIMLVLSFNNLAMPLNGDQLAHSQQSKLHSITLIDFLSNKTEFLNNFNFKWLIYIVDLLTIFAGFLLHKFTKNKSWLFKIIIFSSLFLFFRFSIIALGGSAGPHPPFRLFPLWLTSAIFTSTDFSFRLAQFIGLIGLIWLIQKVANKKLNFVNSWLFALTVGIIPVLWHVGVLVEQSIWTAMVWTLFLLYFLMPNFDNKVRELDYIRWISIISIFTLLRQSSFVAFLPLFLIILIDFFNKKEFNIKKIFILTSPIFLMLPFLLNSIINGTSASYSGKLSSVQRVWEAFNSGIIFNAVMNSISWPWIIFLFIPILFFMKNPLKISVVLIFFIAGVYIFYMIDPGLWGMGRYQAEYVIPFIVLGFFIFVNYMVKYRSFASKFLPIFFALLIIHNIYIFKNLASFNKPIDELKITFFDQDIKIRGQYAVLSEFPYEYKRAFVEAKDAGYAGNIFVAGATYGVFGEILNNFTVLEVRLERDIYKKIQSISPVIYSSQEIDKNYKIKLVLITDYYKGMELKKELENLGWQEWKEFKNEEYGSTIFGLFRKNI